MDIETYKRRSEHSVSERTLDNRISALKQLENFSGGGEPSVNDVEEYIDNLLEREKDGDISPATVREYYKSIRSYFEKVKNDREAIEHIDSWLPPSRSSAGDYMTFDELDEFRDSVRGLRDQALVDLMYFYARRPKEILFLNEEDIDLDEKTITFPILKKSDPDIIEELVIDGESYDVFRATFELRDEVLPSLKQWMKYKPDVSETVTYGGEELDVHPMFCASSGRISYQTVYRMITLAAERAGLDKNITPKSLRHSRATHLDMGDNVPEDIARNLLLHGADTQVISRYVHDRGEEDVREVLTVEDD